MALNRAAGSKAMAYEYLNQALESQRGIKIKFPEARIAQAAKIRMYGCINEPRKLSMEMFDPDDPKFGRSPFENIHISMDPPYSKQNAGQPCTIYLRKIDPDIIKDMGIEIEEI